MLKVYNRYRIKKHPKPSQDYFEWAEISPASFSRHRLSCLALKRTSIGNNPPLRLFSNDGIVDDGCYFAYRGLHRKQLCIF
jgi:hypothetical protein